MNAIRSETCPAADPESLLQSLAQTLTPPNILVMDENGADSMLAAMPLAKRQWPQMRWLVLLDFGMEERAQAWLAAGADDYVTKPVSSLRLQTSLRNLARISASGENHHASPLTPALPVVDVAGAIKSLEAIEMEAIHTAVEMCGGCLSKAARELGIGRSTLYRKLQTRKPNGAAQIAV